MIYRGYSTDTGLRLRMILTGLFLFALYSVFALFMLLIGADMIVIFIICGALVLAQFFMSDKLVLRSMKARVVTREEMPDLHGTIENLCQLAGIPKPNIAVSESLVPNAFAAGRSPKKATICVTNGILRMLNERELEAVLGHEVAHIKNRDVAMMTLASFFSTLIGMAIQWMSFAAIFGGMGRSRQGGQHMAILMVVMLVSILVYFISQILIMALSRYREFAADESGAVIVGAPATLATALLKIHGEIESLSDTDLRHVEGASAFFFVPAFHGGSLMRLFSSHPPVRKRVERLKKMQESGYLWTSP